MTVTFEKDIVNCLHVLHNGGLILYPTDTVWGIGCDATNAAAVQKIYTLKKRDERKSMIILVSGEEDILRYVGAPHLAALGFLKTQTRPTTLVFESAVGLPANLIAEDGSIAIRIVSELFCKQLIERFGKPLVSTSANISGTHSPKSFADVSGEIVGGVDYVVQYRRDETMAAQPSQIIKWEKDGSYKFIRS